MSAWSRFARAGLEDLLAAALESRGTPMGLESGADIAVVMVNTLR